MTAKLCDCGHPPTPTSVGTGYGYDADKKTYCYACCAKNDKEWMREHGRITIYASFNEEGTEVEAINWPGTLRIKAKRFRRGTHMCFGVKYPRLDFWFDFEGYEWHGVVRGAHNEVATCKRTKRKTGNV